MPPPPRASDAPPEDARGGTTYPQTDGKATWQVARPNWEYIRVDVLLPFHPKLDGLTYTSKWTLIELWSHCGQHLTDGFVRDAVWKRTGTLAAKKQLLEHDLASPRPRRLLHA